MLLRRIRVTNFTADELGVANPWSWNLRISDAATGH